MANSSPIIFFAGEILPLKINDEYQSHFLSGIFSEFLNQGDMWIHNEYFLLTLYWPSIFMLSMILQLFNMKSRMKPIPGICSVKKENVL